MMLRMAWKRGVASDAGPAYLVSATRFVYRRRSYLALVSYHAWRLRRAWGSREGSVGLMTGAEMGAPITYSLSVWANEDGLRKFLRAPDHLKLMRSFRPRLAASQSVTWKTDQLMPEELWREGMRRLADAAREVEERPGPKR